MLKKTVFAAVAAALLLAACSQGSADKQAAAAGEKTYVVATDAAFAPFEYQEKGQLVGFSVDLLDAISKNQNIKFRLDNTPWEGIFATLGKGDSDMISSSVTITDERKQSMDFSEPYFEATQMIVTTDKSPEVKSFADLKNRTVAVLTGSTGDLVMQKLQGNDSPNIKRYEGLPLALKELVNGSVDAAVGDNGVVQFFAVNNPNVKLHMLVEDSFEKEAYGFAVRKGRDDELLPKVNAGIAALKADGTYQKIYDKWFAADKAAQ